MNKSFDEISIFLFHVSISYETYLGKYYFTRKEKYKKKKINKRNIDAIEYISNGLAANRYGETCACSPVHSATSPFSYSLRLHFKNETGFPFDPQLLYPSL